MSVCYEEQWHILLRGSRETLKKLGDLSNSIFSENVSPRGGTAIFRQIETGVKQASDSDDGISLVEIEYSESDCGHNVVEPILNRILSELPELEFAARSLCSWAEGEYNQSGNSNWYYSAPGEKWTEVLDPDDILLGGKTCRFPDEEWIPLGWRLFGEPTPITVVSGELEYLGDWDDDLKLMLEQEFSPGMAEMNSFIYDLPFLFRPFMEAQPTFPCFEETENGYRFCIFSDLNFSSLLADLGLALGPIARADRKNYKTFCQKMFEKHLSLHLFMNEQSGGYGTSWLFSDGRKWRYIIFSDGTKLIANYVWCGTCIVDTIGCVTDSFHDVAIAAYKLLFKCKESKLTDREKLKLSLSFYKFAETYPIPGNCFLHFYDDFDDDDFGVGNYGEKALIPYVESHRAELSRRFKAALVPETAAEKPVISQPDGRFTGQSFVVEGSFQEYSKNEMKALIAQFGGTVENGISAATDYFVCGEGMIDPIPDALRLGVKIVPETYFYDMLRSGRSAGSKPEKKENEITQNETHPVCGVLSVESAKKEWKYKKNADGTLQITRYSGSDTNVCIPTGIGKAVVTKIGIEAFKNCSKLKSVTIPDSVTTIGGSAFIGCRSLTDITIPDSVTTIGGSAFEDCSRLTSITIPEGVTTICDFAFAGCIALTRITIPDSVTEIELFAFEGCRKLKNITLPRGIRAIGEDAFKGCKALNYTTFDNAKYLTCGDNLILAKAKDRSIPSCEIHPSTKIITGGAFSGCRCLTNITIPAAVTEIGAFSFENCSNLRFVSIPEGVTRIGTCAFEGCRSLERITIPDSVTKIDGAAFEGCSSLQRFQIPDSVTEIDKDAFVGCRSFADADGFVIVRDVLYGYFGRGGSVAIPSGVRIIGERAFEGNTSITSISCPDSLQEIGIAAFCGCSRIRDIFIPDSVAEIRGSAFEGCSSLKDITIPNSVTSIYPSVFQGCSSLKDITIPDSVTSIYPFAFQGCSSLREITIPDSVTAISWKAFEECSSLQRVTIPDSVKEIGDSAFKGCRNLTVISIPARTTRIPGNAFSGCNNITIYAPEGSFAERYAKNTGRRFVAGSPNDDNLPPIMMNPSTPDIPEADWHGNSFYDDVASVEVTGKTFVLTGEFEGYEYDRDVLKRIVESKGGRCTGSVSGKTDYVVIGALGGYGEKKISDVLDQRAKGKTIKIIHQDDLMKALENM